MYQYNHETAMSADQGGSYITESCVVRGLITYAKWTKSGDPSSQSESLEIGIESEDGKKANYISICWRKRDGSMNEYGDKQIHSLMGCTGLQGLNQHPVGTEVICPDLKDKQIAVALERVNYLKGDGSEGYKLEPKAFMRADSWQTVKEFATQNMADTCEYWKKTFAAMPDGKPAQPQNSAGNQRPMSQKPMPNHAIMQGAQNMPNNGAPAGGGYDDFDQDIPFDTYLKNTFI